MGITVLYLFIFAFASIFKRSNRPGKAKKQYRYAVLYPAYKEDKVILSSVSTFLKQDYPSALFDVVVISDQMTDETNEQLKQAGATVLKANYKDSSKAKALQLAMNSLDENKYDVVVIMDGDNLVDPDFLERINNQYDAGCIAIQGHRMAKNRNTSTALLDAVSEEMNNSIFRKGHVRLGFSSALIGSGMAFQYQWFKKNIFKASTAGEDKELEALLLKQRIHIEYLEDANVYDEKIPKDAAFYNQRRRWLAANYGILTQALPELPKALFSGNWDYCDKIFQWMMLPRIILLGAIGFFALLVTLYDWTLSIKWWSLLLFLIITLCIAVPRYLVNKDLARAIIKIPKLGILMFLNLFRLRGVNKKFIHTDHSNH
ncbi:glycosyltransferase family 2 protein [Bacteroides sp. 51]|uniref:glycosyltransferase n=1 Tax=Bacteroides sp. 51 TaxID=2302938 RepID=UPI001EF18C6C|nr:glycosyltransferase family 2 protein [Bacteroides sp. 51]